MTVVEKGSLLLRKVLECLLNEPQKSRHDFNQSTVSSLSLYTYELR